MLVGEIITISSNVIVTGLIIWMVKSSTKREVDTIRKFTERPKFDQMDQRIEKAAKISCSKTTKLRKDFEGHSHEGSKAKVILK